MKVSDLASDVIEKIKTIRYDWFIEKHEGPWDWGSDFKYHPPEFIMVEGRAILLPIEQERLSNITILRLIASEDGKTLTIFLKDTTYSSGPEDEWLDAGRLAICEQMPGEQFYVATVYHEWMIVENQVFKEA